jgi:hypothetical protein
MYKFEVGKTYKYTGIGGEIIYKIISDHKDGKFTIYIIKDTHAHSYTGQTMIDKYELLFDDSKPYMTLKEKVEKCLRL